MKNERTAQEELERLSRALRTLSGSNRALLRAEEEPALLREICRVVVEEAGYRAAIVARAEQDENKTVTQLASVGLEDDIPELRTVTWADTEFGRGATGIAIRTGEPCVINNTSMDPFPAHWREATRQHGFASLLALPLRVEGTVFGTLTIAAREPDAFDEKEKQILLEAADDLAFGLETLRVRARAAAAQDTIKHMVYFDSVTGLPNRVRLRELLGDAIDAAKAERRPLALLRVEIERFREINETLGDDEIDALMRDIATRLQSAVGVAGQVARVAESEFAVVAARSGAEQAAELAQRILAALTEPFESSGLLLDARANIGVSLFPGHGTGADALMRRASIALNQARSSAGYALFKEGLDHERARRLSLMGDLRRAIERGELLLYCQPKLEMSTRRVCGAEMLVRWQHPQRGMVQPGEFIKLAESTGIITPLTYWVLDATLQQSYAWHAQGLQWPLSVNLSARDLREPKLLDHIEGALATWGAQAGWIEFELTESALMEDPAAALETLTRLKRLNVHLAIDDFGTGYSSLAYLQRLPVDTIKVDQSFVCDMATNENSATIVRSTIELAHNLHLTVVAEGVEDQVTFDRLVASGCDMAQGFCICRPMPIDQFKEWEARPMQH